MRGERLKLRLSVNGIQCGSICNIDFSSGAASFLRRAPSGRLCPPGRREVGCGRCVEGNGPVDNTGNITELLQAPPRMDSSPSCSLVTVGVRQCRGTSA